MWQLKDLFKHCNETQAEINGKYVPARPINYTVRTLRERAKEAYEVFSGKADCFYWPEKQ